MCYNVIGVPYVLQERGRKMERLAEVRKEQGLSQEQLAERSGVCRVSIARYETGKLNPTLNTLEKLAAALGTSVGELVDGRTV